MTFLNVSLLAGSALVVVPIVLHLIMRQRPKRLEFPALRFLQKRHESNQRRLRLRHLLLLLLRAAAIALLALALARPSVKFSEQVGRGARNRRWPRPWSSTLAPHMQYRHENSTRLEVARELGLWLLAQLPPREPDRRAGHGPGPPGLRRRPRPEPAADRAAGDRRRRRSRWSAWWATRPAVLAQQRPGAEGDLRLHRPVAGRLAGGTAAARSRTGWTTALHRRGGLRDRRGRRAARRFRPGRRPPLAAGPLRRRHRSICRPSVSMPGRRRPADRRAGHARPPTASRRSGASRRSR